MPKKTKRKICVVTGTRADYGSLYWLMKEIKAEKKLEITDNKKIDKSKTVKEIDREKLDAKFSKKIKSKLS